VTRETIADDAAGAQSPRAEPRTELPPRRSSWKRLELALLAAVLTAELGWTLLPPPRDWVESVYSRGLYRWIARAVVPVADQVPFSLSLVLCAAAAVFLPALAIVRWRSTRRAGASRLAALGRTGLALAKAFVVGYGTFLLVWGAGYGRRPLTDRLGLEVVPVEAANVERWVDRLAAAIERDLPPPELRCRESALASLRSSLEQVVAHWDGSTPVLPVQVKRLPPGTLLVWGSVGVTIPWLLEAHVDGAEPDVAWLATATHELAHVAGLCGEADADFAAALAGLRTEDRYARYAIELWLYRRFLAELAPRDAIAAFERLPPLAREDIEHSRRAYQAHVIPALSAVQSHVYERYLRSQRVTAGLKEYSWVTRLLVAAERRQLVQWNEQN